MLKEHGVAELEAIK